MPKNVGTFHSRRCLPLHEPTREQRRAVFTKEALPNQARGRDDGVKVLGETTSAAPGLPVPQLSLVASDENGNNR